MSKTYLKDRLIFEYGYSVRVDTESKGIYPVYGSNGITGHIDSYKVEGPGIIIGRKGSVGSVNYTEKNYTPTDTAYYVSLVDIKKDDLKFWYYYLQLLGLEKLNTHSAVPGLSREIAYFTNVNPPDLNSQKKIASVLSVLDSKIELNNRINSELESMAKTLYDYWFVQFDFPDKNGKPYKSSGGKMVWNDDLKREIPEGWGVDFIGNILERESSIIKIPTSQVLKEGIIPVIDQSQDFVAGYTNDTNSIIKTDKPRIIFGDHTRIVKLINFDFARGADGTQVMLSKSVRMPQHLFYHSILKIDLSNYGYARHFKFLKDNKIVLPSENTANFYDRTVESYYNTIRHNIFQNKKLAELRDWLLPMLMNGQVKVE
jgi:type I restriction enzyme, S subunit